MEVRRMGERNGKGGNGEGDKRRREVGLKRGGRTGMEE